MWPFNRKEEEDGEGEGEGEEEEEGGEEAEAAAEEAGEEEEEDSKRRVPLYTDKYICIYIYQTTIAFVLVVACIHLIISLYSYTYRLLLCGGNSTNGLQAQVFLFVFCLKVEEGG